MKSIGAYVVLAAFFAVEIGAFPSKDNVATASDQKSGSAFISDVAKLRSDLTTVIQNYQYAFATTIKLPGIFNAILEGLAAGKRGSELAKELGALKGYFNKIPIASYSTLMDKLLADFMALDAAHTTYSGKVGLGVEVGKLQTEFIELKVQFAKSKQQALQLVATTGNVDANLVMDLQKDYAATICGMMRFNVALQIALHNYLSTL